MGGRGSGRPPSEQTLIKRGRQTPIARVQGEDLYIPNLSGVGTHTAAVNTFLKLDASNDPISGDLRILDAGLTIETSTTADPTLTFKTTNTANQMNVYLDESTTSDMLVIEGKTAGQASIVDVRAKDGTSANLYLRSGSNISTIAQSSNDDLTLNAATQNKDIIFQVNDGGATTEVMRIDGSTSRVGIGTDAPDNVLHVKTGENNPILLESTDSISRLQLKDNNTGDYTVGVAAIGDTLQLMTHSIEALRIDAAGNIGIGIETPNALLEIDGASDEGKHLLELDQDDDDEPFIKFDGTSAADQTKNISTVNGDGSVEGPKNYSSTAGWAYQGMIRIDVNGTDYWIPYYSADTS